MEVVLLIARLLLALVFVVAGIAKAADLAGSRKALVEFGVPEKLAGPLGWGLPPVEIIIAAALLPLASAWWGAVAALAMFLVFTAGIAMSLARGKTPDCHCFGQLQPGPVSRYTLARNFALMALAGLIVIAGRDDPGPSALNWLSDLRTAEAVNLTIGLLVGGLLITAIVLLKRMLGQQETLIKRVNAIKTSLDEEFDLMPVQRKETEPPSDGLPVGAIAPKFSLPSASGGHVSLDDLLNRGGHVMLLFVGPNCMGCKTLLPAVRVWQDDYGDQLTIAVLSYGSRQQVLTNLARYEIENLLIDEDSAIARTYQSGWTPAAVVIHPDGRVATQIAFGDHAVREFVRNFTASSLAEHEPHGANGAGRHIPQVALNYSARKIGEAAPVFSYPDLSGKPVSSEELFNGPTLLLFWHAASTFCQAMADDLVAWEASAPLSAPRLVLIATGQLEEVKALTKEIKSPILHDSAFELATLMGTKYAPSAILIDGEGRIASTLAMGEQNVRALVGLPSAELQKAARF